MINLYPGFGLGSVQSRLLAFGLGSWVEVEVVVEVRRGAGGTGYVQWVVRKIRLRVKVYYAGELVGVEEKELISFERAIDVLAEMVKLNIFVKEVKVVVKEVEKVKVEYLGG